MIFDLLERMRMKNVQDGKHQLNTADAITFLRMIGTILLLALQPLSGGFFLVYILTGLTDLLDGWLARKIITASDFGAKLDSIADLLFYTVVLFQISPFLWRILPGSIWYAVAVIVMLRISAYLVAAQKYGRFTSLHTYLNKLTGIAVFLVPFFLVSEYGVVFCWLACAVAAAASLEELIIHGHSKKYSPNEKSIFTIRIHG